MQKNSIFYWPHGLYKALWKARRYVLFIHQTMTCILNITLTSKCYHAVQRNTCWSTSENKLQPVSHRPHSSCIQQLTLRILTAGTLKYDPPKVPLHAGGIWTPHPWALCPHKFTSEMASQLVQPCSTAHAHDHHRHTYRTDHATTVTTDRILCFA